MPPPRKPRNTNDPERIHAVEVRFQARLSWWFMAAVLLPKWFGFLPMGPVRWTAGAVLVVIIALLNRGAYGVIRRASAEGAPAPFVQALWVSLSLRVAGLLGTLAMLASPP